MKVIDKYVLKNFLLSYLITAFALIGLYVVGDLGFNGDEFTKHDHQSTMHVISDIADYYGHQVFLYYRDLSGIITLVAAIVTLITMNLRNEMTALLASGIPLYRIIWPVVILGLLFNILAVANQELILPRIADQLVRRHEDTAKLQEFSIYSVPLRNAHMADDHCSVGAVLAPDGGPIAANAALGLLRLSAQPGGGGDVNAIKQMHQGDILAVHEADSANVRVYVRVSQINIWNPTSGPADVITVTTENVPQDGHGQLPPARQASLSAVQPGDRVAPALPPTYYLLSMKFHPDPENYRMDHVLIVKRHALTGEPVARINATAAQWVVDQSAWRLSMPAVIFINPPMDDAEYAVVPPLRHDSLLLHVETTPREIVLRNSSRTWMQFMSTADLREYSESGDAGAVRLARATMHIRFTQPAINMILLLLGTPFVLIRSSMNLLPNMVKCVALCGGCFVCSFVFQQIAGDVQAYAIIAAWMPVILFGPLAVLALDAVET